MHLWSTIPSRLSHNLLHHSIRFFSNLYPFSFLLFELFQLPCLQNCSTIELWSDIYLVKSVDLCQFLIQGTLANTLSSCSSSVGKLSLVWPSEAITFKSQISKSIWLNKFFELVNAFQICRTSPFACLPGLRWNWNHQCTHPWKITVRLLLV